MANKRFLEMAERNKNQGIREIDRKDYPTPEDYSVSELEYRAHINFVNPSHAGMLDEVLVLIQENLEQIRLTNADYKRELRGVKPAVVGSSLVFQDYNDIDILVVGITHKGIKNDFYSFVSRELERKKTHKSLGSYSYVGFPVSGAEPTEDNIVHFIVAEDNRSFREWHEMMVDNNDRYCILNLGDK